MKRVVKLMIMTIVIIVKDLRKIHGLKHDSYNVPNEVEPI